VPHKGGGVCRGFIGEVDRVVRHFLSVIGAEGVLAEHGVGMAVWEGSGGGI
jgi:hypothetical protein